MDNTNLFKHAPKELVTDAFLTWLFYYLDSDDKLTNEKNIFFNLFLLDEDKLKPISSVSARRQDKHTDIIVCFDLAGEHKCILFENKTWTTIHGNQLEDYKKCHPDCYRYFYLKLAYINYEEIKIAKKNGYAVIDSCQLADVIQKILNVHPFVQHYYDYLVGTFCNFIKTLKPELYDKNNYQMLTEAEAFKKAQAQEFIISDLYRHMEGKLDFLSLETGSSKGRPWTQLYFAKKESTYGDETEYIFWRIDERTNKSYIRMNQYSNIGKEYQKQKLQNLNRLRKIASDLSEKYGLKEGRLGERGLKESEIVIYFLNENTIRNLVDKLPLLSIDFYNDHY